MADRGARPANDGPKPLAGVRVIDLTRVMSGPFCTLMLADLGAEVIKVEAPAGDITRHVGGHMRNGVTALFLGLNRGKKSFVADLTTSEGRDAVAGLAATADVFIENFRPGVTESMGLDAATLRSSNPRLICLSITGYGPSGPMADFPAYDTVVQAQTGMIARQSSARGQIDKVRSFPVDKLTGLFASQAVIAALFERESTGRGRKIDVPMFDATMYYLWSDVLAEQTFVDDDYTRVSDTWRGAGVTSAADGPIVFLAVSLKERHGVLRAVGRDDLVEDERFATLGACLRHSRDFHVLVTDAIAEFPSAGIVERLRTNGVSASAVLDAEDVVRDGTLTGPDFFVEWEHADAGRVRQPRSPIRFDQQRHRPRTWAAALGEHTADLMGEMTADAAS